MKTVKISRNVIHGGRILKAGQTHELEDEHADLLVEGEHAELATKKGPDRVLSAKEELMAKTKPELLAIADSMEKEGKKVEIAPDAKKEAIVAAILMAAGYKID
jgi:hypothetical protein